MDARRYEGNSTNVVCIEWLVTANYQLLCRLMLYNSKVSYDLLHSMFCLDLKWISIKIILTFSFVRSLQRPLPDGASVDWHRRYVQQVFRPGVDRGWERSQTVSARVHHRRKLAVSRQRVSVINIHFLPCTNYSEFSRRACAVWQRVTFHSIPLMFLSRI